MPALRCEVWNFFVQSYTSKSNDCFQLQTLWIHMTLQCKYFCFLSTFYIYLFHFRVSSSFLCIWLFLHEINATTIDAWFLTFFPEPSTFFSTECCFSFSNSIRHLTPSSSLFQKPTSMPSKEKQLQACTIYNLEPKTFCCSEKMNILWEW